MSRANKIPLDLNNSIEGQQVNKGMKLSRKQLYWLSQVTGWTFFIGINLFIISSFEEITWQRILVFIFLAVDGIFFTHLLRAVIRKNDWLNLPLKKTIPRVLIASIVTGTIIYAFVFAASYVAGTLRQEEFNIARPIAGSINTSILVLLWSVIYFAVHYLEN